MILNLKALFTTILLKDIQARADVMSQEVSRNFGKT